MYKLEKGACLKMQNSSYAIAAPIGSGAVGEVYKGVRLEDRTLCAVKLLFAEYATDRAAFHRKLNLLVRTPPVHPAFAWPTDVSRQESQGGFAYAMPLREGFDALAPVMRQPELLPLPERLALARAIAEPFAALHKKGLIYVDYSATNIRWRKEGEKPTVSIIDCDNITIPKGGLGLQGTGLLRAPEVMLGGQPTLESDYHSEGALLFHLLVGSNPLRGQRVAAQPFTPDSVRLYFGEKPSFIFLDPGNAPVDPRMTQRWEALPARLRAFFRYLFCEGCLQGRMERPTSAMLLQALSD